MRGIRAWVLPTQRQPVILLCHRTAERAYAGIIIMTYGPAVCLVPVHEHRWLLIKGGFYPVFTQIIARKSYDFYYVASDCSISQFPPPHQPPPPHTHYEYMCGGGMPYAL